MPAQPTTRRSPRSQSLSIPPPGASRPLIPVPYCPVALSVILPHALCSGGELRCRLSRVPLPPGRPPDHSRHILSRSDDGFPICVSIQTPPSQVSRSRVDACWAHGFLSTAPCFCCRSHRSPRGPYYPFQPPRPGSTHAPPRRLSILSHSLDWAPQPNLAIPGNCRLLFWSARLGSGTIQEPPRQLPTGSPAGPQLKWAGPSGPGGFFIFSSIRTSTSDLFLIFPLLILLPPSDPIFSPGLSCCSSSVDSPRFANPFLSLIPLDESELLELFSHLTRTTPFSILEYTQLSPPDGIHLLLIISGPELDCGRKTSLAALESGTVEEKEYLI